mgnify:CR=1 FL=1
MIFRYYARYAALIGLLNIILERKDDPICRLEFHFLELGKVDPNKPIEEMSQIERLAVYLRYADDENYKDSAAEGAAQVPLLNFFCYFIPSTRQLPHPFRALRRCSTIRSYRRP